MRRTNISDLAVHVIFNVGKKGNYTKASCMYLTVVISEYWEKMRH